MKILTFAMPRSGSRAIPAWIGLQVDNSVLVKQWEKEDFISSSDQFIVYRREYTHLESYIDFFEACKDDEHLVAYVLRDPWNHLASYLQMTIPNKGFEFAIRTAKILIDNHKVVMKHRLGITSFFPENSIFVCFNLWFKNLEYRKYLAKKLGLPHYDRKLTTIYHPFESLPKNISFDGDPASLSVFDRWKNYVDKDYYRDLFDNEIVDLASQFYSPPFVS